MAFLFIKNRKEELSMLSRKISIELHILALTTSLLTSLAIMRNNHDNNYLNKLCENVVVVLTDALYTMLNCTNQRFTRL